MPTSSLQQQIDDFLTFATCDVLIWHDPTGAAPRLIELVELPGDVALYIEQDMSRFELLRSLNDIAPDERALVIRSNRKRIEEGDWFADLEARADNFEPDLDDLPRDERSVLNRTLHALQREQGEARWEEEARRKHEEKTQRRAANRQAWWRSRYGIDAPERYASAPAQIATVDEENPRPKPNLSEAWYTRDAFLAALNEAGVAPAPESDDSAAREVGYSLFNDCAIRGSLSSPSDYYRVLFAAPLLCQNGLPEELRASASFKAFLASAQMAGSVLEYDEETWITSAGLQELEIKRADLDAFAQQAVSKSVQAGMPQFTVPWLRAFAADIPLLGYELSDAFYESVLLSRKRFATRGHLAGRRIFAEPHTQARGRDLVESLLRQGASLDLDELFDIIHDDYGIGITRVQLLQLVRAAKLYYSPELDRVYVNHAQFIREVE